MCNGPQLRHLFLFAIKTVQKPSLLQRAFAPVPNPKTETCTFADIAAIDVRRSPPQTVPLEKDQPRRTQTSLLFAENRRSERNHTWRTYSQITMDPLTWTSEHVLRSQSRGDSMAQ